MSLIIFAACLLIGIQAENSFGTTIGRALVAMAGTFVIGLIIGAMAQKMLDENLAQQEQKDKNGSSQNPISGR